MNNLRKTAEDVQHKVAQLKELILDELKGLSNEKAAFLAGVSTATIFYLRNDRKQFRLETILRIAKNLPEN